MMVFCPEHPKRDQNLKFTPLSETTSIPAPFIWDPPPPPRGVQCQTDWLCFIVTLVTGGTTKTRDYGSRELRAWNLNWKQARMNVEHTTSLTVVRGERWLRNFTWSTTSLKTNPHCNTCQRNKFHSAIGQTAVFSVNRRWYGYGAKMTLLWEYIVK